MEKDPIQSMTKSPIPTENSLKAINSQITEPNIPLYNNYMSTYSIVTLPQPAVNRQSVRKIEFPFKIYPNYFITAVIGL